MKIIMGMLLALFVSVPFAAFADEDKKPEDVVAPSVEPTNPTEDQAKPAMPEKPSTYEGQGLADHTNLNLKDSAADQWGWGWGGWGGWGWGGYGGYGGWGYGGWGYPFYGYRWY